MFRRASPPVVNHPEEARFAAEVMREVVGDGMVDADFPAVMGAEDFAHMLRVKPGCYAFIGNGDGGHRLPDHAGPPDLWPQDLERGPGDGGTHHPQGPFLAARRDPGGAPETFNSPEALRAFGFDEHRRASAAIDEFTSHWQHGGSTVLRTLIDADTIELLGGPLAHPFQPLLNPRLREFALREGLSDAQARFAHTPGGIWAPECAYAPGMENGYAAAGVTHFMVDGPTLHGDTTLGRPVGESNVVAFGRDLQVSYRVWSPKSGYPGHGAYRDFHTYDHLTGLKPARVTGRNVASESKAPYDPARADQAIDIHVADFVNTVRRRLISESERIGRPAHVVAAFDTELYGHWWHEGPEWLARVLRALPEAGVKVGTLSDAINAGFVGAPTELPPSSWGSGKDWQVWSGEQVADLVALNAEVVDTALTTVDKALATGEPATRDRVADQILRETLLTVSSDWPFMVSKDTAAEYARYRAHLHAHATREISGALAAGRRDQAERLAEGWNRADGLFGALDARRLPR